MKENIRMRKEKFLNARAKVTNEYKRKIELLDKYIRTLDNSEINEHDDIDTIVFKLYMQLDNVSKVAKVVNELGFRIITNSYIGERKYNSNDITSIITNKDALVSNELKESVQEIQKINYGKISKRWF